MRLPRSILTAFCLFILITVSSCGSGEAPRAVSPEAQPITIEPETLRLAMKGGDGRNLIDLAGPWTTWTGAAADVSYDRADDALFVMGSGDQDLVLGMQRVMQPLVAGVVYRLMIDSAMDARVILFLFGSAGQLIPVPGQSGLATAYPGADLVFTAPVGVTGFFVQIQNAWQATEPAVIRADLQADGGGDSDGQLIDQRLAWTDWFGSAADGVGYNARTGFVGIVAPVNGEAVRFGVQQYNRALPAGDYVLSLSSQTPGAMIILYLFDRGGQLITDGVTGWIAASATTPLVGTTASGQQYRGSIRFTVAGQVAAFAVQIQGPWGGTDFTSVDDLSLRKMTADGPFINGLPEQLAASPVSCRMVELRTIPQRSLVNDTGVFAANYLVAQGRFVAGAAQPIDPMVFERAHVGPSEEFAACFVPSRRVVLADPPTFGPPDYAPANRSDGENWTSFQVAAAAYTIRTTQLANGDTRYQWDLFSRSVSRKRWLTVNAHGNFKSCQTQVEVPGQLQWWQCGHGVHQLDDPLP